MIITKEEYSKGYKNILKAQTPNIQSKLAIEIQNRTVWTNKKGNQSNMKDIHNTTIKLSMENLHIDIMHHVSAI